MCLCPYFTSEPTELTGLFVEKPPENVVAVSGMVTAQSKKNLSLKSWCPSVTRAECLFGDGRNRCLLHSQGGLNHLDQKTHHEVAEREVDGPGQQGWEAHAV